MNDVLACVILIHNNNERSYQDCKTDKLIVFFLSASKKNNNQFQFFMLHRFIFKVLIRISLLL